MQRKRIAVTVMLGLLACSLAYSQTGDAKPVIAVLDFQLSGVSAQESVIFVDSITSYIVETQRFRVIDRSQRKNLLSEIEFASSDCTDEGCQLKIGRMLSANDILVGSLGKIGDRYLLTIRMLNVETGEALQSVTERYRSLNDLIDNSQALTYKLVGVQDPQKPAPTATSAKPAKPAKEDAPAAAAAKTANAPAASGISSQLLSALDDQEYLDDGRAKALLSLTEGLSEADRKMLYDRYALSGAFFPAVGNTLFGLGSWMQGDIVGGLICTGLMASGLVVIASDMESEESAVIGAATMLGGMVAGWIIPFVFEADNNTKLRFILQFKP